MYEYDPQSKCDVSRALRGFLSGSHIEGPESSNGQKLLCRTEFHSQSEYRSSVTIARRMKGEDMVAPQAKLICGGFGTNT